MDLLIARGLTSAAADGAHAPLLAGVDLRLEQGGRVGLVGPSGGTSALLRLLAGVEPAGRGSVTVAPGVSVSLLERHTLTKAGGTVWQVASRSLAEVEALAASVAEAAARLAEVGPDGQEAAGAAYDALLAAYRARGGPGAAVTVRRVLAGLGFGPARHADEVATLTDDDRRRLALAATLASGADVLLLDEPTDRLDLPARRWLEGHLSGYRGAIVVVSSDRALLDGATDTTAFLVGGALTVVRAPYSKAAASHHRHARGGARRRRERDAEAERLEALAAELAAYGARRRAARPARQASSSGTGRGAQPMRQGALLLRAEHLTLEGLFEDVEVRLAAGERVALLGPAGSGASELMSLLASERHGDDAEQRLWYAPGTHLVYVDRRTRGLAPGVPVVEHGTALLGRDAARRTLAATGLPYGQWTEPPERLSAQDCARLGLAIALARPCDVLLLDEPGADLDLDHVEALEADLQRRLAGSVTAPRGARGAGGATARPSLVIVTHDRYLALALADRAWSVVDGSLVAFSSVPAYLRGDAPVAPPTFWEGGADLDGHTAAPAAAVAGSEAAPTREALELERADLLEALSDPLALGDREIERARQRVADIEAALMTDYDASFPPAAPRYRLVEGGLTLHADLVDAGDAAATRLTVVACEDERLAASAIASAEPPVPWLDVRAALGVAHLRVGTLPGACLLPATVAALVDAGVYLSFTVLGASSVQLFSRDTLPSTLLSPVGDGWWRVTLESFLKAEGWSDAQTGGPRRRGGGRRRRTRKAVGT